MTKKKETSQASLPALVLALTATATSACTMAPPYAYLRIDAPNVGHQTAQPHKREIVHYSQGPQQHIPPTDCNTYAATAQDSMRPSEKQTTVTVCNDGQRWTNHPQPTQPQPTPMKVSPPAYSRPRHVPNTSDFNIGELLSEFRTELSAGELWESEVHLRDGSTLRRMVHGKVTGGEVGVSVCQVREGQDSLAFACYIDANDTTIGTYLDGNVDLVMHGNFTKANGMACLGNMLSGQDQSCMNISKVQPHERHRRNQEYHRAARWAIRAHQRR